MSARRHRELARSVRTCRRLSKDPRWVADVVLSALRHVGITAPELRALADLAAEASKPRLRVASDARTANAVGSRVLVEQVEGRDEPIDRKTAASGG